MQNFIRQSPFEKRIELLQENVREIFTKLTVPFLHWLVSQRPFEHLKPFNERIVKKWSSEAYKITQGVSREWEVL